MSAMRLLAPLGLLALLAGAWQAGGWPGVALAVSALVLWALLHYTRLITVMKRAARRPIGYVGSAVMLNARLRPRLTLLHVVALTQALGERLSDEGAMPEVYRWRDPGGASVTAAFDGGRLARWTLARPAPDDAPARADQAFPENGR